MSEGASALYICPTCGCPDLMMPESSLVLSAKDRQAKCPNCGWSGTLREAAGILTSEKVYDTKAIAQLLFHVAAKHAAGPLAQALALIGLLDPKDQEGLDKVMRDVCAAVVEAAFTSASERALELRKQQETAG
jgi:DNA-directed RNA polymerase subunit RPC12/RpoP